MFSPQSKPWRGTLCAVLLMHCPAAFATRGTGFLDELMLAQAPTQRKSLPPPDIAPQRSSQITALARAYYSLGKELYLANRFVSAVENFERAIKESPQWGEAYLYLGMSYAHLNRFRQADDTLKKALQWSESLSNADKAWAHKVRGIAAGMRGDRAAADSHYRRALAVDPGNTDALNGLAYSYAVQGVRLEEALGLIDRALAAYPNEPNYLDTRGWILYRMGRYKEAERVILDSLRKIGAPANLNERMMQSDIHLHLGKIYVVQGQSTKARAEFEKAISLYGSNAEAQQALSTLPR